MGAHHSDATTFTNFFQGFIYSLKFWNQFTNPIPPQDGQQPCPDEDCQICPTGATECLRSCDLDTYYDSGTENCESCTSSCLTLGCVRDDQNCNLCEDLQC